MNYPPGMSRSDYDHVEGITRCMDCGADISIDWEAGECDEDYPACPGGCGPDPDQERDAAFERAWDREHGQ